ncbi:hypothetical protein ITJ43_14290 [Microbacterium sp. VKM Ac-2870]|uniref:DUF6907 domain-containing protein n=1 Tax=Microbacterium sp. VKM Ac-2870 TaxID=2783825 RepID=UPI00188CA585|nr:hypothetical protein [Microbacterium sp. VKM Ac-2870]MBF4563300.1 hypothetical protein [Microbacterium sp. VKM Ac-2870]
MLRERPSWLTEPCPSWCQADHQDQDHPDDRYHQSRQVLVSVVAPKSATGGDASATSGRTFEPDEMTVLALHPVAQVTVPWVVVVGERQFIEVTLESAIRIHAALGEILYEVR